MIPQLPETAPFSAEQRAWVNGYLAGLFSGSASGSPSPARISSSAPSLGPILFLYGSQTGTAEGLAKRFAKEAKKQGFDARVVGMEEHAKIAWEKEKRLALITSTYGDGEMPDNAQVFWDAIADGATPSLGHVEFSVLALGDTNYVQFCEAGKKFDQRLEALGAKRAAARIDCDVDYDTPAKQWLASLLASFSGVVAPASEEASAAPEGFSKANPFPARLKTNRVLNGPGSAKETRHFEIVLEGSGLAYEAGDALGVVPRNCPGLVAEILDAAGLDGNEPISLSDGGTLPLRTALLEKLDLTPFRETLPSKGGTADALVGPLRKLQPRLYSISSSPKAHPGEVHLTVGIVRYEADGRKHKGVCSTFLAERAAENPVSVFVHSSPHFRPPADGTKPMIMVGPGTGIAPFRAFLEERRAVGATGRNWLFFGDQKRESDFLYREELEAMRREGTLHRLDLAFSRDQAEKLYVQNRMIEHAAALWSWFGEGAHFYVCGDAKRMAKDVDAALHRIAETEGGLDAEAAAAWVKQLKADKRYLRDVY